MASCTQMCCLLLGILFGVLFHTATPVHKGRQRDKEEVDGIRDCIMFLGCECGDAERQYIRECYDLLGIETKHWVFRTLNRKELCPSVEWEELVDVSAESLLRKLDKICTYDKEIRDPCIGNTNSEFRSYYKNLTTSLYPEDIQESMTLHKSTDCMLPFISRCGDYPGTCMSGNPVNPGQFGAFG